EAVGDLGGALRPFGVVAVEREVGLIQAADAIAPGDQIQPLALHVRLSLLDATVGEQGIYVEPNTLQSLTNVEGSTDALARAVVGPPHRQIQTVRDSAGHFGPDDVGSSLVNGAHV